MSTDFEEAVIAFAQLLDAKWSDPADVRRCRRSLLAIVEADYGGTVFGVAMRRLIESCTMGASS